MGLVQSVASLQQNGSQITFEEVVDALMEFIGKENMNKVDLASIYMVFASESESLLEKLEQTLELLAPGNAFGHHEKLTALVMKVLLELKEGSVDQRNIASLREALASETEEKCAVKEENGRLAGQLKLEEKKAKEMNEKWMKKCGALEEELAVVKALRAKEEELGKSKTVLKEELKKERYSNRKMEEENALLRETIERLEREKRELQLKAELEANRALAAEAETKNVEEAMRAVRASNHVSSIVLNGEVDLAKGDAHAERLRAKRHHDHFHHVWLYLVHDKFEHARQYANLFLILEDSKKSFWIGEAREKLEMLHTKQASTDLLRRVELQIATGVQQKASFERHLDACLTRLRADLDAPLPANLPTHATYLPILDDHLEHDIEMFLLCQTTSASCFSSTSPRSMC